MTKLEKKLIELGYELVVNGMVEDIKTYIKNINNGKCHFVQIHNGKLMGAISDEPNEMQKDLEVLKKCQS